MLKLEYFGFAKEILQVQGSHCLLNRINNMIFPNSQIVNTITKSASNYKIFIDIGAASGHVSRRVAPRFSKCVCFEPSKKNYEELMKNIKNEKLNNVISYNYALGSKMETKTFYCSENNPYDNRFSRDVKEKFIPDLVQVVKLDDICDDLRINEECIIKIDVQGYELEVMRGSTKLLEKNCVVISEFWPWGMYLHKINPLEYVEFMKSIGYSFFNLNGKPVNEEYIMRLCKFGKNKKHAWDDFLIKRTK